MYKQIIFKVVSIGLKNVFSIQKIKIITNQKIKDHLKITDEFFLIFSIFESTEVGKLYWYTKKNEKKSQSI